MFSFKKLLFILPIVYLVFQLSPINPVDLRFSGNSEKLSTLNFWIKKNKTEYEEILKTEVKENEDSFKKMVNDIEIMTEDKKFSVNEVKELSKDIQSWESWNSFRTKSIIYSILFLIICSYIMKRWG